MRDLWFSESENNHQMNTGFPSENVLNLALTGVKSQLQVFFNSPDAFEQLDQVFDITDPKAADLLIKNGVTGNFENIPNLQILPDTAMNGSQGAFSNNKDTIYLAESLVQADILGIQETLIEELGHKFDTLLNPGGDTSGDEGELFKNIVLGLPVSEPELLRIQTENDFGTVVVDNQVIAVEQSYNTTVSSSPGFTKNRGGWTDNNNFPRLTGDVNGDGRADIVGFSASNVFVSFGNSNGTFGAPIASSPGFTKNVGRWTDNNNFPRLTGDVNGDGRADIVGFGASNVFVSSGNSNGTFGTPIAYSPGLTKNVGDWTDNNNYPRVAGDVNNDGKADLIGFGASDVFASLAGAVTPPPLGYYPELSLSETQWDQQSGDNNQFEQNPYGGGGDQRGKTDDRIEQIYTDLSKAIFGSRIPMTAGYAYDQSYYNGVVIKGTTGWWHAGLDIGANNGATIKAPIGGTVKWTSGSGDGNIFVGINSDDGRQWVYGHLKSKDGLLLGKRINTGETVGIVGALNHLHLEVENGLAYGNTDGAMKNQETLLSVTVSPLMAYWKWRNR